MSPSDTIQYPCLHVSKACKVCRMLWKGCQWRQWLVIHYFIARFKQMLYREFVFEWSDGHGRTRTNRERKSRSQQDAVTIGIGFYQNKLTKIVPQIQRYDKYLQGYMREAERSNRIAIKTTEICILTYSIYKHYYYTIFFLSHAVSYCDISSVSTLWIYLHLWLSLTQRGDNHNNLLRQQQ